MAGFCSAVDTGNREQRNPPLLPELMAACGAVDFLRSEVRPADVGDVPVMHVARAERGISWQDLPLEGVKERLGRLIRFSAYWLHMAEPLFQKTALLGSGNWTQRLRGRMKPAEHEAQLLALRRVARDVLAWAAAIERMSGTNWSPGLWRTAGFLDPRHQASPTEPIALAPPGGVVDPEAAFDQLLRQDAGEPVSHGAASVYDALVSRGEHHARGNNRGYGRVAAAVFRATGPGGEA